MEYSRFGESLLEEMGCPLVMLGNEVRGEEPERKRAKIIGRETRLGPLLKALPFLIKVLPSPLSRVWDLKALLPFLHSQDEEVVWSVSFLYLLLPKYLSP